MVVTNHMKYGYEKNAIILDGHKRLGELSQYCREHYSKRYGTIALGCCF